MGLGLSLGFDAPPCLAISLAIIRLPGPFGLVLAQRTASKAVLSGAAIATLSKSDSITHEATVNPQHFDAVWRRPDAHISKPAVLF